MSSDKKKTGDAAATGAQVSYPAEIEVLLGIFVLYLRLEERIEQFEDFYDLSKPERKILVGLDQPNRMGDLAKAFFLLPSSVTAAAKALEAKGLVRRVRDPQDGRAWLLSPTNEGLAVRDRLIAAAGDMFTHITGLPVDERHQLADLLVKVGHSAAESGLPKGLTE